ncbi:CCAAT/enhancer-binding protein 2-like isoform X1 [Homalodisca vitripennis]|uniref:CCAAT/enhancer-binding protein 2-like isoform X1 n=1 Tax=Homalodisca vitripennis TaxID=197043 RepID=UPI001EE9D3F6|nr:CCAAT/enhancer-binding protein 2-like isoform X1 [Homalodisca vitripennis]
METSNEQRPTIKHRSLKCHSDSDSGKDEIYRQHRNRNNEAVERCRKRKAEQAERIKGRIEDLERQNEKLSGYIEAQKQEIIRMQKNCEELRVLLDQIGRSLLITQGHSLVKVQLPIRH